MYPNSHSIPRKLPVRSFNPYKNTFKNYNDYIEDKFRTIKTVKSPHPKPKPKNKIEEFKPKLKQKKKKTTVDQEVSPMTPTLPPSHYCNFCIRNQLKHPPKFRSIPGNYFKGPYPYRKPSSLKELLEMVPHEPESNVCCNMQKLCCWCNKASCNCPNKHYNLIPKPDKTDFAVQFFEQYWRPFTQLGEK